MSNSGERQAPVKEAPKEEIKNEDFTHALSVQAQKSNISNKVIQIQKMDSDHTQSDGGSGKNMAQVII